MTQKTKNLGQVSRNNFVPLQVKTISYRFYGRQTINARNPGGREQGRPKHTRHR